MRTLLGLLLLALGWLCSLSLCREAALRSWISADWRLRLASATALWGALLVLVVESLSRFRGLKATALLVAWLIIDIALLSILVGSIQARNGRLLSEWFNGFEK